MTDVTLYTDIWGSFFRQILAPDWIKQIAHNCGCNFSGRVVVQNNIAEALLDEYCVVLTERFNDGSVHSALNAERCANKSLARLGLKIEDFSPLLYQSLADIVAIDHCPTEYIVFFSGDSVPWGKSNWVQEGIAILQSKLDIMIVNPMWNGYHDHARFESVGEEPTYFLSHIFSDQRYLARTADLRADIYHETNADADRIYCATHGNTFEKRVGAYMFNHNKCRAILKSSAYLTRP